MTRTSTPSAIFRSSNLAICIPTEPSRQPNIRMWTDDRACSMSLKMRGKKFAPSTHGSIVAAVDHAKSSAASCGRVPLRCERRRRRLRSGRSDRIGGGGQLGFWVIPSTCLYTRTNRRRSNEPCDRRPWRPRFRAPRVSVVAHCRGSYRPRPVASRVGWVASVAVVVALLGVFVTWTSVGNASLDGTQGPNNGWLVVIVGVFALGLIRLMARGSWVGVLGVFGASMVMLWTTLENWLDNRDVLDGPPPGIVLVLLCRRSRSERRRSCEPFTSYATARAGRPPPCNG